MNWINGLNFNGKHSLTDFNLTIQSKKIEPPSPQIQKETIPFMNGAYDFSTFGSGGEPVFGERNITVKFGITAKSKEELYAKYSQVLTWLIGVAGKKQLIFDEISEYYFLARIESVPAFEQVLRFGTLEIVFVCNPYKYSVNEMGSGLWDDINFETDWFQETNEFTINGNTNVTMYNNGVAITPNINCSSNMTVTFLGKIYNLVQGDNKPWGLKLSNGKNTLTFNGNGKIKILFNWEVL